MRALIKSLATICILCCWVVTPSRGQGLLDLTTPEVQQIESRSGGCAGGGRLAAGTNGPTPLPELRLTLTIEHLDSKTLKVGDEVVAELQFTSIGEEPQRFPLSSRWETAYDKNCGWLGFRPGIIAQRGWVRLEFADEAGYTEFIASHPLFATTSDPNSFRTLAPGQSVRVKLGGKIYFQRVYEDRKPKEIPFTLPQEFAVTASFSLDDSSLWNPYKKLRSTNQVRIRVAAAE